MLDIFKKKEIENKSLEEMNSEELKEYYSRNRNRKLEAKVLMPTQEDIKKEEVGL